MIIDNRIKPPFKEYIESGGFDGAALYFPNRFEAFPAPESAKEESMELFFDEMAAAEVGVGVIIGKLSQPGIPGFSNEALEEVISRYPSRFIGLLGTDMSNIDYSLEQIEKFAKSEVFRGVNIDPATTKNPLHPDDEKLFPIYEACLKYNLPVSIGLSGLFSSMAGNDLTWADPIPIQRVAMRYPELKIIISHGAWPYVSEVIAIALSHPNVYVSPDFYASTKGMPGSELYLQAANLFLEDQFLFGSCYPQRSFQDAVNTINEYPWRNEEVKQKILYRNAAELFGIKLGDGK